MTNIAPKKRKKKTYHGLSNSKIYKVHTGMKQRCDNPKNTRYKDYGGRGIRYQKEWVEFEVFLKDMGGGYSKGMTLEREDVNGHYTKDNCIWVEGRKQMFNMRVHKRTDVGVTFNPECPNRPYAAKISVNNKTVNIGQFATKEEAIMQRKKAEKKYWN